MCQWRLSLRSDEKRWATLTAVGYTQLFLLSFAVAVPSMLILPLALRLPQLQDPVQDS